MALRFWHVTGHRHWYFYVLALVCVACWNAAVLVLPPAQTGRAGAVAEPPRSSEVRESGEGRLINLTDFRYGAGRRGSSPSCNVSVTFVSKLLTSNQFR